ncbi:hypothetical protein BH11VER1_BH11VER1_38020 [soil metagenome]
MAPSVLHESGLRIHFPIAYMSLFTIGFVPSLEAMPLVAEGATASQWSLWPSPSYGRIMRQLLANQIAVGLLPLDVFLAEIVNRPALISRWRVPIVLPAAPIDLVLTQRIMKQIHMTAANNKTTPLEKITIGIESRNSLTRYQFIEWLQAQTNCKKLKVSFKMLPMELMFKALKSESLDGCMLPTPWGFEANDHPEYQLVPTFTAGKLNQELVLCWNSEMTTLHSKDWHILLNRLAKRRGILETDAADFDRTANTMSARTLPHCHPHHLKLSAERYLGTMSKAHFCPDFKWIDDQIARHARLLPTLSQAKGLEILGRSLALEGV